MQTVCTMQITGVQICSKEVHIFTQVCHKPFNFLSVINTLQPEQQQHLCKVFSYLSQISPLGRFTF